MQARKLVLAFVALLLSAAAMQGQSPFAPKVTGPLSQRVVAYQIDAKYLPEKHVVEATETLTYHNLTGKAARPLSISSLPERLSAEFDVGARSPSRWQFPQQHF